MTVTPNQFLERLAASPKDAAEFDSCAPRGMSRREHVELTLAQVKNSCANVAESQRLQTARATNAQLKSDLAKATARLKFFTPPATVFHNLHAAAGKKLPIGPAKPSATTTAIAPAPPIKPQRELTGFARTAAAFAATAPKTPLKAQSKKPAPRQLSAFERISNAFK